MNFLDMGDLIKHIVLCLHPFSFFLMIIKETVDVSMGYIEPWDWLGDFIGIAYYLLFTYSLKQQRRFSAQNKLQF